MDTNELARCLRRLFKVGLVSSVDVARMTARVVFPDQDDTVSHELPILTIGSKRLKMYWVPAIDEQVLCMMLPNKSAKGANDGFIVGTWFSDVDMPDKTGEGLWRIAFGDGSYIEHDNATGDINIHATGNVNITGSNINLN